MNNVNPMELVQMIKGGANPQQLMLNFLEQRMGQTPMGANLLSLARNGQTAQIEQIARNMCAQRGINYDQAFADFKRNIGY